MRAHPILMSEGAALTDSVSTKEQMLEWDSLCEPAGAPSPGMEPTLEKYKPGNRVEFYQRIKDVECSAAAARVEHIAWQLIPTKTDIGLLIKVQIKVQLRGISPINFYRMGEELLVL